MLSPASTHQRMGPCSRACASPGAHDWSCPGRGCIHTEHALRVYVGVGVQAQAWDGEERSDLEETYPIQIEIIGNCSVLNFRAYAKLN
jgi:hypothetical protein